MNITEILNFSKSASSTELSEFKTLIYEFADANVGYDETHPVSEPRHAKAQLSISLIFEAINAAKEKGFIAEKQEGELNDVAIQAYFLGDPDSDFHRGVHSENTIGI